MVQKLTTKAKLPNAWYWLTIVAFIVWTFAWIVWSGRPEYIVTLWFAGWVYVIGRHKQSRFTPDRTAAS